MPGVLPFIRMTGSPPTRKSACPGVISWPIDGSQVIVPLRRL